MGDPCGSLLQSVTEFFFVCGLDSIPGVLAGVPIKPSLGWKKKLTRPPRMR